MSKELDQLVAYIEENTEGYSLKGNSKGLDELLNQLFSSPEPLDFDSQRKLFLLSMRCYPLFSDLLNRDLNTIPELLRYSLLSKCFYRNGMVATPISVREQVSDLLDEFDGDWYDGNPVGYSIHNLRDGILEESSLDAKILEQEFNNTGDVGNVGSILRNPNCPIEFLHQIIASDHEIFFEENQHEELIEEAKKILTNRQ
jgi:hypothetical protein